MSRRRRRRRDWPEDFSDEEVALYRRKRRRYNGAPVADGQRDRARRFEPAVAAPERPKPPVTCRQCSHLVITRSFVKHVSQSWDHAVVFRTLTCFQQCWTLEDPDSVPDHGVISEYLVGGADQCPSFVRGLPRDHEW